MDDARLPAMAEGADHHAERGGRLALGLAGVDDQQAFFLRLGRHDPVMGGLFLLHLFGMLFGRALDHCGASLSWERSMAALFDRSEEHTSELQSLMRISYAVFCLKKKKNTKTHNTLTPHL